MAVVKGLKLTWGTEMRYSRHALSNFTVIGQEGVGKARVLNL